MHHLLCVRSKSSQLLGFTQDFTKSRKAPDNTYQDHGRVPWGEPAGQGGLLVLPKHWMEKGTERREEERRDSSVLLRIYQNTLHRCDLTVAAAA